MAQKGVRLVHKKEWGPHGKEETRGRWWKDFMEIVGQLEVKQNKRVIDESGGELRREFYRK